MPYPQPYSHPWTHPESNGLGRTDSSAHRPYTGSHIDSDSSPLSNADCDPTPDSCTHGL